VALFRAMTAMKGGGQGRLWAAHFNHQLRGKDADADEAFVLQLCQRSGVPCEVGRAPSSAASGPAASGLEAAARHARYEFLVETAARRGARYVATAHTADDQVETVLHRILRGTGIGGLAGIQRARPLGPATLIRPLLAVRRVEILAYLADLGQPYCCDSSNRDTQFTRNRIRHELLPQLAAEYNPGVADVLLRLAGLAGEVQEVIDGLVEDLAQRAVTSLGPEEVGINALGLAKQPAYLVRELLMALWRRQGWPMQAMGHDQWERLEQMAARAANVARRGGASHTFPGEVQAEAADGRLWLRRRGPGSHRH